MWKKHYRISTWTKFWHKIFIVCTPVKTLHSSYIKNALTFSAYQTCAIFFLYIITNWEKTLFNTAWHHPSYAFTHWHVLVTLLFYFNSSMWCVCESFWPSLLLGEQLHWKEKLQVLLVFHHKYCNTLRVWDTCDGSCVWLYCALKRPDHHELWGLWWKALSCRNQIFNPGNSY